VYIGVHGKNVTMKIWWWNSNYNVNKFIQILLNTLNTLKYIEIYYTYIKIYHRYTINPFEYIKIHFKYIQIYSNTFRYTINTFKYINFNTYKYIQIHSNIQWMHSNIPWMHSNIFKYTMNTFEYIQIYHKYTISTFGIHSNKL
jgi:hypothetical protein